LRFVFRCDGCGNIRGLRCATTCEVTVKVADVEPAATTTVAGVVAVVVLLLERVTVVRATVSAAAPFRLMVAAEFADPPMTAQDSGSSL
jgi:hypothetical protein